MPTKRRIEIPPETKRWLEEMDRQERERRTRFLAFVEEVKDRPHLERAERWLHYVARHRGGWGDEEALTYLRSRGLPMEEEIEALTIEWRAAEREAIRACAQGWASYFDGEKRESRTIGGMSLSEASRIRELPTYQLRDFWVGYDHQEMFIDSVMLRAAQWCDIGGFEPWWDRMADEFMETALTAGIEPIPASYHLFYLARADLAHKAVPHGMLRVLEGLEVPRDRGEDGIWRQFWFHSEPEEWSRQFVSHYGVAGNLAVAEALIRRKPSDVADAACQELLRGQNADGWWPTWQPRAKASVVTTATALHALSLNQPHGWIRSAEKGAQWLLSVQEDGGYWEDPGQPDPVFLTVLVLDALALVSGAGATTFTHGALARTQEASTRRFRVALSFPGEERDRIEPLAIQVAEAVGKEEVLYDRFHTAEFARPNLDIHLQRLYHDEADLIVVLLSGDYQSKEWCGLEWRAIRDLIKTGQTERVMFLRTDDAPVDGTFSIDGYVDIRHLKTEEVSELVLERLRTLAP